MEDTSHSKRLIEELNVNIDKLESNLTPLTEGPLTELTEKLPLLERAKIYTLTTYAILSLTFSTLKLNDIDATTHPVFKELTRCKEYFTKIKSAETAQKSKEQTSRLRLDKEAAARFIKHGTAGNEQRLKQMAEAKEKAKAAVKRKAEAMEQPPEPAVAVANEDDAQEEDKARETPVSSQADNEPKKKQKKQKATERPKSSKDAMEALLQTSRQSKKKRKADKKKAKKAASSSQDQ